jgi:hypothetical protein
VVQNKEPKHFLSIFDGRMVVHKGKGASWRDWRPNLMRLSVESASRVVSCRRTDRTYTERAFNAAKVGLYQVGKLGVQPARTVQADARVTSLNSNSVFLLVTPPEVRPARSVMRCVLCRTLYSPSRCVGVCGVCRVCRVCRVCSECEQLPVVRRMRHGRGEDDRAVPP